MGCLLMLELNASHVPGLQHAEIAGNCSRGGQKSGQFLTLLGRFLPALPDLELAAIRWTLGFAE
jgi:hypothetical protein